MEVDKHSRAKADRGSVQVLIRAIACLSLICGLSSAAWSKSLQCPARAEVLCVPGAVADRVVCAMEGDILEYPNVTAFCLACHDLVVKPEQPARSDAIRSMRWMHPLEVEYPAGRRNFMPADRLYSAIHLAGGRISCASCHGGRDADIHYLSVHARHPHLCTHCHNR